MTAVQARPGPRWRWHLLANAGVALWLVALLGVALGHRFVPEARWLLVHLLLLGAVTNAVLVWSAHFARALLKNAPGSRRWEAARLAALNAGVVGVVAGLVNGTWTVVLAGALVVGSSVAAHGIALARQARAALPSRFGGSVHYYVAASACLPVGAGLGTVLAHGVDDRLHGRVALAHVAVNVIGWVGLTVLGTLLTLWPTIVRTRISAGAERHSRQALPVLVAAVAAVVAAALSGALLLTALALLAYVTGALWSLRPLFTSLRRRTPESYAAWSVLAGVAWLVGSLLWLAVRVGTADDWDAAGTAVHEAAAPLAAGFAAQLLLGALTYLVPVVLGGGPARVRAATAVLERGGTARVVVANAGLAVCLLPVPSLVRVVVSVLVLAAHASFLVLVPLSVRASRAVAPAGSRAATSTGAASSADSRAASSADVPAASSAGSLALPPSSSPSAARVDGDGPRTEGPAGRRPVGQGPEPTTLVRSRHTGMAAAGLASVVLAVAVGVAIDPAALGTSAAAASAGVAASGETTTVRVEARGMRFHPASAEVPAGNRVVIEVVNRDSDVHDLALESGEHTGRLSPGETGRVDVPVVGRSLQGWCTIVGHRQTGMLFSVKVTGHAEAAGHPHGASPRGGVAEGSSPARDTSVQPDFIATPPPGFAARDAALPPVPAGRTHRLTLSAQEVTREVAVGVSQRLWTFNGTAPGPVVRGRVGDRFEVTLRNDAGMGHSIDFHAGSLAPDQPMRTLAPGRSATFSFTATRAGIWMYHCSSMPMSVHIANGMFGAVVIEPPGLARVGREYLLVQSELYLGAQGGPADASKVSDERPDAVVFNGFANQYDHDQLAAGMGERVRIWVLDAGPSRPSSFHVVGGQFDTVFSEGAYLLRPSRDAAVGGAQALALQPAQGGFVELTLPEAGHYPFVSHVMVDAERGAHGILRVTG